MRDPTDKHPCWQANIVKGFPAGKDWRDVVCCNYLDHVNQCNNDLHYCVDHVEYFHKEIPSDLDLFEDKATFEKYLPLVMAMAPADPVRTCGLGETGNDLSSMSFVNGVVQNLQIE